MARLPERELDLSDVRAVQCLDCPYRAYLEDYRSLAKFHQHAGEHEAKLGHELGWPDEVGTDWPE